MVKLNNINYNASVEYFPDQIILTVSTDEDFNTIFTGANLATEVGIFIDDIVVDSYPVIFNGIEKTQSGYKIIYNRTQSAVGEVEALTRTVAQQKELLDEYAITISQQEDLINQHEATISQQNDLISQQIVTIEEQSSTIIDQRNQINSHDDAITENTLELNDIVAAITELGDILSQVLDELQGNQSIGE